MAKDVRWWRMKDGEAPHQAVLNAFRQVQRHTSATDRETTILEAIEAYEDESIEGGHDVFRDALREKRKRRPINVTRTITNTIHAEITQSTPRPMALTEGGNFEAQQQAKQLTKMAEAIMYDSGGDAEAAKCAKDAIAAGDGIAKIYEFDDRVRVGRVLPHELFVDPLEGRSGKPRTLYQCTPMDRAIVEEQFGDTEKLRDIIDTADVTALGRLNMSAVLGMVSPGDCTADMIEVVEAWRLPSSRSAKDGRHVICVSTGTLVDEPWEDDSFPFAKLPFQTSMVGYWGKGVAQILGGIQARLDSLDDTIEETLWMLANARVFVPKGANINLSHLQDNRIGAFVEYEGNVEPKVVNFQAVSPELYAQRDFWISKAFEETGVSQMAATSMKPAGLDSGRALRTYADLNSKRFVDFAHAWQEFYVEIARQCFRCAKRISKRVPDFTVVYKNKTMVERIRWADVDIDEDSYVLQVFPISMLPGTPAGKLAALQELRADGTISAETFYRLADFPDLDSERELQTAPRDLLDKTFDYMLTTGDYVSPEPAQNLALALNISLLRYQKARIDTTRADRVDLLRRYMTDVQALQETAANKNAGAPPGDPMAAAGGALPVDPTGAMAPPMPQGIAA